MTATSQDRTGAIRMTLDYITIRGFRSLRSLDRVALGPRNVLIGANGSGKSNFIAVFDLLGAMRRGRLRQHVARLGGADNLLWFGTGSTEELFLETSFNDGKYGYRIELVADSHGRLAPVTETCWFWDRPRHPDRPYETGLIGDGVEAGISKRPGDRTTAWVQQWLDGVRSYHFHDTSDASPMRKLADIHDTRTLRPDAANLGPYLRLLEAKHPDAYTFIRKAIQRVAPFFDDFVLAPQPDNEERMLLEWRHEASDHYFNASSLSDGTLRFMALATLLLQPEALRPSVIVLDEPELGLHPYAIAMLAGMVKSASAKTQVILATQSSLLLDHFEPADVLVAELSDNETTLRRLEEEPLAAWLDEYSLGQLWEKNQLGGRPGGRR